VDRDILHDYPQAGLASLRAERTANATFDNNARHPKTLYLIKNVTQNERKGGEKERDYLDCYYFLGERQNGLTCF
jgi:hypothetical protein